MMNASDKEFKGNKRRKTQKKLKAKTSSMTYPDGVMLESHITLKLLEKNMPFLSSKRIIKVLNKWWLESGEKDNIG